MYPRTHALTHPDKLAAVMVGTDGSRTDDSLTYAQLDERSTRLARVLAEAGLTRGDVVALLSHNSLRALEVYWAALRSGLYVTTVNCRLSADEVAYILNDSGAAVLVVAADKGELAGAVQDATPGVTRRLVFGGALAGCDDYEEALAGVSGEPLDDEPAGAPMLYTSGTTGRPKGVRPPLPSTQVGEGADPVFGLVRMFGVDPDTVYLSCAPIYHAAPLRWCGSIIANGGTVVMMPKFDAEETLAAIGEHGVTHGQFVPTMFVRMLKLPEEVRGAYDVSSLRAAIHAAAPCPVEVKQRMIDWWGPVLVEYYAGTEANGMTMIDSETWLTKRGSVGEAIMGVIRICDDDGHEVGVNEVGTIYFEREALPFSYHNDPEKTRAAQHPLHEAWTTVGDMGYVDEEGFLYLSDRRSFMIISGGVNIYPAEIESVLALHPAIQDVAVIGVPDEDMGEVVRAVVQPARGLDPDDALGEEIITFVRAHIAHYKAPRAVDFVEELPRSETGKLVKHEIRDRYLVGPP